MSESEKSVIQELGQPDEAQKEGADRSEFDINNNGYSEAIHAALDGYANDSETWLAARDIFYEALNRTGDLSLALESALDRAADGAESTVGEASARFWDNYNTDSSDSSNTKGLQEPQSAREYRNALDTIAGAYLESRDQDAGVDSKNHK